MSNLLTKREIYKPFHYPWAYEAYKSQNAMHWIPDEITFEEDIKDWNTKLTYEEKQFLTQIFRFFTQADVDVAGGYIDRFMPMFKHPELRMMMASFANMEAVHIDAYSRLIDTVGMPESEYEAFTKYSAMLNKHDYLSKLPKTFFNYDGYYDVKAIAKSLAVYSAFTEGLQLFSSFAMLLNFSRRGLMKGMSQVVTWSVRDESLHVESMIRLFRTLIEENPEVWTDDFKKELYDVARDMVQLEDDFIDLAFETGAIEGLDKEDVKKFVRYIADRRLLQLGLKTNFGVKTNPLPWYDEILNTVEHVNFFENRVTEYSRGTLTGSWENNEVQEEKTKEEPKSSS